MGFSKTFLLVAMGLTVVSAASVAGAQPTATGKGLRGMRMTDMTPEQQAESLAHQKKMCARHRSKTFKLPSEYLEEKGVNPDEPCPNFDNAQGAVSCGEIVARLEEAMTQAREAREKHCNVLDNFGAGQIQDCSAGGCNGSSIQALDQVRRSASAERRRLHTLMEELGIKRGDMARGVESTRSLGNDMSNIPTPNQRRINHSSGEIDGYAGKVEQGSVAQSDISGTRDSIIREPLQIAEMIQVMQKQMQSRDQELQQKESEMAQQSAQNQRIQENGRSLTQDQQALNQPSLAQQNSGTSGTQTNNVTPAASSTSQGASGGGAGIGALAGLAGPAAGLMAGGGSGAPAGGADYSMPTGTGNAPTYGNGYNGFSPNTDEPISRTQAERGSASNPVAGAIDISNDVAALKSEASGTAPAAPGLSSSSASRRSLKDSLRARLANAGTGSAGGTAGSSSGASMAPGSAGSGGKSDTGTAEKGKGYNARFENAQTNDVLAAMGGDSLGSGNFDLVGSETDAYVQNMVGKLSADLGYGGRGPASEPEGNGAEILAADTESLFLRTSQTHVRCIKKGLLMTRIGARL